MKTASKLAAAALVTLTASMMATSASAAIVCNQEGQCWHTRGAYAYHPEWGIAVHPNNWRWGPNEHFAWREHPGRGYWRGGVWVGF